MGQKMTSIDVASVKEESPQWQVLFLPTATKQFEKLDKAICRMINKYIKERLTTSEDPRRFGKELVGNLKEFWRYRIGDYRLICKIEDEQVLILVVRVDHRKEVYD
jgi:mRNA interferase RelE/StbE